MGPSEILAHIGETLESQEDFALLWNEAESAMPSDVPVFLQDDQWLESMKYAGWRIRPDYHKNAFFFNYPLANHCFTCIVITIYINRVK